MGLYLHFYISLQREVKTKDASFILYILAFSTYLCVVITASLEYTYNRTLYPSNLAKVELKLSSIYIILPY